MSRRVRPAKAKVEATRPLVRKSLKNKGSRVRDLEKRLAEALEQQTATSEILRAISGSPTDVQPVFDTIARNALRLCGARSGFVTRFDGELIHLAAMHNVTAEGAAAVQRAFPMPPGRGAATARAVMSRAVVNIADFGKDPEYQDVSVPIVAGDRSLLSVPMLREGIPIGAITVTSGEPAAFNSAHFALLQTFADQAVIAIENVRLFTELQEKNRAVTEALEQQTATSEILRALSSSPTDEQPVFDSIAHNSVRLCGAVFGVVATYDRELLHLVSHHHVSAEGLQALEEAYPMAPNRGQLAGRAILERAAIHVPDVTLDPEYVGAQGVGNRSTLSVPMLRTGTPIGQITIGRLEPLPFTEQQIELLKTFADEAVIAIENVRLFTELQEKNRALTQAHAQVTEALEQQTATSEILRAISSSPTEDQPVFDTIVRNAAVLCGAMDAVLMLADGDEFMSRAHHGLISEVPGTRYPLRGTVSGRAVSEARVVQVKNLAEADDFPAGKQLAQDRGYQTTLAVPLIREGVAIGAISIRRAEVRLFTDKQIALLQTFADQAVIALENVRLFKELEARNAELTETLARQRATGEVLRAISRAQTDAQPVFDIIATSARRLCGASYGQVQVYDGELIRLAALDNVDPEGAEAIRRAYPLRVGEGNLGGRVIGRRAVVQIPDLLEDGAYQYKSTWEASGLRSLLGVPMLRDGEPIGAIAVGRAEPGPFPDKQVELLQIFAAQAVIAIENARLFNELETRNRDLTVALDRQTATAEVLRVISSSSTDVQPVFNIIAERAAQLCGTASAHVFRFDGELLHLVAIHSDNPDPASVSARRAAYPRPPDGGTGAARAIRDRRIVHIRDVFEDPEYRSPAVAQAAGFRAVLVVPMLHEGQVVGAISIGRATAGPFSDKQVDLLQTFADQAVIAIENARLFSELQARTAELTRSVDELTTLGEVSRALSSTLDLETVLQTIVARANQLAGTAGCTIWEYDETREEFRLRVSHYTDEEDTALLQALGRVTTIRKGQGVTTQVMVRRQPVQIPDIAVEGAYESPIRRALVEAGHRALLGVPLLREDEVIGVLAVTRKTPGEFEPEIVRLLTTLATQSALAIQNARLFLEIEDKSRQLEAASRHKSEFLANMSHELRTPLNAIIGFSEVLAEGMFGEINEKQTEYLNDILESGRHLLSLINDILDLSKIEAGRMELEPTDFDLPQAIENALILVRERASRRGIALGRTLDERLGTIRGDERKVKQVLLNLLSNALKFTPEGGRIDVSAHLHDDLAEIAVSDTGVGIAPEDQEALFEEFRQVGTADKKVEGTGLGLALSRKFIELHGGRIWVQSEVGRGSTFTFTLPLRR